jgi:hypothetical protein
MTDFMGSEQAEEATGAKENFIGQIIHSDPEEMHSSVDESQGGDWESDFEQPAVIEPLTQYESLQYIYGLNTAKSFGSKWQVFVGHIENIHGPLSEHGIESMDDFAEFLEGRVYEWRELTFEEDEDFHWEHAPDGGRTENIHNLFKDSDNPPNALLVPVREVTDANELAEIGAEESAEVEEVDF